MTNDSYDPNKSYVITSVIETVVSVASDDANHDPVEDIIIDNVAIQHGAWNVNCAEPAEAVAAEFLTSVALMMANLTTPLTMAPTSHKILSREISYGGNAFPSSGGIFIRIVSDIVIADNTIHPLRYNGISVAQSNYHVYAKNVLIQGNYVYNIGRHIPCDQAAFYTVGIQPGTVITGNVVKNVFTYAGFYFHHRSLVIL